MSLRLQWLVTKNQWLLFYLRNCSLDPTCIYMWEAFRTALFILVLDFTWFLTMVSRVCYLPGSGNLLFLSCSPKCRVHTYLCSSGNVCLCIIFCNIFFHSSKQFIFLIWFYMLMLWSIIIPKIYSLFVNDQRTWALHQFKAEAYGMLLGNV